MNQEELQVAAFEIILHSGTARTEIHEALCEKDVLTKRKLS